LLHLPTLRCLEGLYVCDRIPDRTTDPHEGRPLLQPSPSFKSAGREIPSPCQLNLIEVFDVHLITVCIFQAAIMREWLCDFR